MNIMFNKDLFYDLCKKYNVKMTQDKEAMVMIDGKEHKLKNMDKKELEKTLFGNMNVRRV